MRPLAAPRLVHADGTVQRSAYPLPDLAGFMRKFTLLRVLRRWWGERRRQAPQPLPGGGPVPEEYVIGAVILLRRSHFPSGPVLDEARGRPHVPPEVRWLDAGADGVRPARARRPEHPGRRPEPADAVGAEAFEAKTGCPVIINTTFNVRGEPIVCTPADAYRCFMATNFDVLVLERFVLLREEQPAAQEHRIDEYLAKFSLD